MTFDQNTITLEWNDLPWAAVRVEDLLGYLNALTAIASSLQISKIVLPEDATNYWNSTFTDDTCSITWLAYLHANVEHSIAA